MEEIWKDIVGYEGLYKISNKGNVKSLERKSKKRKCNEIIKKPSILPKGYMQMCLCKNGTQKYISVHRLVALAFLDNPNNYPCINHKDCNPQNNNVNNLEWCTYKENNAHHNHNLKKNITSVIYYLKKNYPNEINIIRNAEIIKEKIYKL